MDIKHDYPLASLNSFGMNVNANEYVEITNSDGMREIFNEYAGKKLILGGGSNILFTKDYPGLVIRNMISEFKVIDELDSVKIRIGAGENWHHVVLKCVNSNWGGIENLSLIPGTVGAAPIQNIGAYGTELSEVFVELEAMDVKSGEIIKFSNKECAFGYRDSIFKNEAKNMFVILSVTLRLSKNPELNTEYDLIKETLENMGLEPSVKSVSDAVINIRRSKLPDPAEIGNAGSFFKNPVIDKIDYEGLRAEFPDIRGYYLTKESVKIPAAWLIESCGWKGKKEGEIGVHEDQALVLVNYGKGSGQAIYELAMRIKESVANKFGIELIPEVNII